jgi:hypothetical protein
MSHRPTDEQQAIIDAAATGADLTIEAGAGTGKTSTLKMLATRAGQRRGVYLAYNKAIATDAAKSFPSGVVCRTAHSFAFGAVGRKYAHRLNGPRVPARETAIIMGIREPVKVGEVMLAPQQLARLATETIQRFCYSADEQITRTHVPLVPGLDRPGQVELARYLVPVAQRAWDTDLTRPDGQLRFTHDVYLKIWAMSGPQLPGDYVLLDEAQDANPAVAALVEAQQAQRILVGDRCQAIYGWRGAVDAMATFSGQRCQLSQSFRFGEKVAAEANKWLDLLDAPLRLRGYAAIDSRVQPCPVPDAVLCRSNAGAIVRAMDGLAAGRRVALVGGGAEIRRMAEAAERLQAGIPTDHPDLFAFQTWREVQEYVEMDAGGSDLRVFVRLIDKHGAREVMRVCDALVDEQHADVIVSTAHKAKGREWDTVRIAGDFQEPPKAEGGQAPPVPAREECMLAYVAVTRARRVLDRYGLAWVDRYVDGVPGWQPAADPLPDPDPEPEPLVDTPYGPLPASDAAHLADHGYILAPPGGSRYATLLDDCRRCGAHHTECRCALGPDRTVALAVGTGG